MAAYRFVTTWCIAAPLDAVFAAVDDCADWPRWWPGVLRAELVAHGAPDGTGRVWDYAWRSRLPYELRFESRVTRREPPHLLEGAASGELTGTGRWRLFEGRGTAVVYEWDVSTTRAWMNRLAPVARPLFAWNHDAVMRAGGEGLARHLGARLLVAS
jgi:hypothetical protein